MSFLRRVVSGSVQLSISNAFVRLLALVTMPVLTGLLSPRDYGLAGLASTVISLASVIALAGIDTTYLRAYHSSQPPSGPVAEHFCWRFSIVNALVMGPVGWILWRSLGIESVDPAHHFAILVAVGIVLSVLSTMSQGRALITGRHRALAVAVAVSGIVGAVASIAIAVWRRDVLALLLPMLLSYLVPILLVGIPPARNLARRSKLSWSESSALVKIGLAGVVTAPMFWVLASSDRWFLLKFQGPEAVGIYSIGYSVGIVGLMINTAVMSVWQPEAAREYEEDPGRARASLGSLMSRLMAAMAVIWLAITAAGGDIVRLLANERFHLAADYVPYIAGGVYFYGVLRLATTGLLLAKRLAWSAFWWLSGGLVCAVLNLILVPTYGGMGAAVTQTISFAFIAVGILATAQATFRVQLNTVRLTAIATGVLAAGIYMARPWHSLPAVSLLIKLPVGLAIGFAVAAVMAPDSFTKAIDHLRQRRVS